MDDEQIEYPEWYLILKKLIKKKEVDDERQ